ncbi:hypothetical protein [Devosia sp. 1566]|uniref:hypothetical protein n=1 Tax=Devosia sp. 1566 TaxID=2499144 RepID=UPI0019D01453|nr:hypothetical protein [Devosia sp. 1566]
MLVYGDAERLENARDLGAEITQKLLGLQGMPPGIARHAALVSAFIRAGELAQGLLDIAWKMDEADDWSADALASSTLLIGLAGMVGRSWAGCELQCGEVPVEQLNQLSRSVSIRTKQGEGYAFYALFPEGYLLAAQRSGLGPQTVVLGIRSIGTGLAAMVAAGLGADSMFTLRPHGHPYHRQITVAPGLAARILADPQAHFAIVDEGPGLSGSSFGSFADWLEAAGITPEQIHFFPSHTGDLGPQAESRHRERWARAQRHSVGFDSVVLNRTGFMGGLAGWVKTLIGPLQEPLRDISGGGWRQLGAADAANWPPVDTGLEKRKLLAVSATGTWLVKWAGLGRMADDKLRRGHQLVEAGWTPEIAGMCHGFLVQRWAEGSSLRQAQPERGWLLEQVGEYLSFRARAFPADAAGASLGELYEMARYNIGVVLGEDASKRVSMALGAPEALADRVQPAHTDNRLHWWEWLVTPQGRLLKTDALDHDSAHDLVGCQDIAWDLAGAAVELELTAAERTSLAQKVAAAAGRPADLELLDAMELCYLGFQIGLWSFAAGSNGGADAEAARAMVQRYAKLAAACLSGHSPPTPNQFAGAR